MEFSRLSGREASPSFFSSLAGDSVGRAFFNTDFLSFRFAAWESTGTSSVWPASELDDESEDESLFRFNFESAGLDRELTDDDDDDDISLASGRQGHERAIVNSVRIGPWRYNLLEVHVQYSTVSEIKFYVVVEAGESCGIFRDSASLASASRSSRHEWSTT
jgi:hypothetical protein